MSNNQKVWIITGATAGIGKTIAEEAYNRGNIIVPTTRRQEGIEELKKWFPERSYPVILDLQSGASIEKVISDVLSKYGRIDVLVNNAGFGVMGAIEEISDEEARDQMEINFFGPLRLTQAVLPSMREKKSGHIIQISSKIAISAGAGFGLYAASKFALEGWNEPLAEEVAPFNIHITLAQPGPVRTEFFGASGKYAAKRIDAYKELTEFARTAKDNFQGNQPGDPVKVAKIIVDIAGTDNPPFRLPITPQTIEAMESKIASLQHDLTTWKEIASSTSF